MAKLRLTLACGPYDRTQALADGTIAPDGIALVYIALQPAEIFWRTLQYTRFAVAECSPPTYPSSVSRGASPLVPTPLFPSRVFRHGSFSSTLTRASAMR